MRLRQSTLAHSLLRFRSEAVLAIALQAIPQAGAVAWLVELPLIHKLGAARVVAEDLVVQVETRHHRGESAIEAVARLGVYLVVSQRIHVTGRSVRSQVVGISAER